MSENVQVDLKSTADTSGFEKFNASYNTLAASKAKAGQANEVFVQSERRVRSNLSDLVSGLSGAKDGTDAAKVSLERLSEVFNVGFAGAVIGGVGAAILGVVTKTREQFESVGAEIDKMIDKTRDLKEQFEGIELSPQEKGQRELDAQVKQWQEARDKLMHPGLIAGVGTLLGDVGAYGLGFGRAPGEAFAAAVAKSDAERQALQEAQNALGNPEGRQRRAEAEERKKAAEANVKAREQAFRLQAEVEDSNRRLSEESMTPAQRGAAIKQRIGVLEATAKSDLAEGTPQGEVRAYEILLKKNELQKEYNQLIAEQKKLQDEAAATAQKEADIKARKLAEETEKAEAAAERQAAKEEGRPEKAGGNVRATILAGSQRAMGGGGGVYSVVQRDPVVDEARKHTTLLTDIAQSVKGLKGTVNPVPVLTS